MGADLPHFPLTQKSLLALWKLIPEVVQPTWRNSHTSQWAPVSQEKIAPPASSVSVSGMMPFHSLGPPHCSSLVLSPGTVISPGMFKKLHRANIPMSTKSHLREHGAMSKCEVYHALKPYCLANCAPPNK